MQPNSYRLEPFSLPIGDTTVSALLDLDRDHGRWDVTVVLTMAPGQPRIEGSEVEAQLVNMEGASFKGFVCPSGPLVETGGSLGTSANGVFRFQASKATPSELWVTYRGQTVRFRVEAAEGHGGLS